jgi:UDP-N-acetylmuramyl pentapeptide synthase
VSAAGAVIVVNDPLQALQSLAHAVRRAVPTRVVAITGSAGKTTTKELTAGALQPTFSVVKNKGNLNNHIGLPLSLMQLRTAPDMAVLELGMNHAGEIRTLVGIAEPDVRVWTNVGDAHMGFFASGDAIADAKAEILDASDSTTLLVCSADDARITARRGSFPGRTVTFGESPDASVRAEDIEDRGRRAGHRGDASRPGRVRDAAPGPRQPGERPGRDRRGHRKRRAAGGRARPRRQHRSRRSTRGGAPPSRPPDRDRRLVQLQPGRADAGAANAGARAPRAWKSGGARRDARAGRPRPALHEEWANRAGCGLRVLFAVGGLPAASWHTRPWWRDARVAVRYIPTSAAAAPAVVEAVEKGDVVLIKGSRGTRCDVVVDRLVQERG